MGTRYLTAVVHKGEYRVAQFGQFNGHFGGAGFEILSFLLSLRSNPQKLMSFVKGIEASEYISEGTAHSLLTEFAPLVPNPFNPWMPQLRGEFGCAVLEELVERGSQNRGLKLLNHLEFAANGLFCACAYVIDLDNSVFEIYEGSPERFALPGERFYGMAAWKNPNLPPTSSKHGPVGLTMKWGFDELPSKEDFLEAYDEEKW